MAEGSAFALCDCRFGNGCITQIIGGAIVRVNIDVKRFVPSKHIDRPCLISFLPYSARVICGLGR